MLYEISEEDSGLKQNNTPMRYQKTVTVPSDEWLTVSIQYKAPESETSKMLTHSAGPEVFSESMSDNIKLASAAAQTAMILNKSPYAGTSSFQSILEQLNSIVRRDHDPYRDEFIKLVEMLPQKIRKEILKYHDPTVTGSSNPRQKQVVMKVVKQHKAEHKACYERELAKNNQCKGSMTLFWEIDENGTVSKVELRDSTLNDEILHECLAKTIKYWRFPAPMNRKSVTVEYPVEFAGY